MFKFFKKKDEEKELKYYERLENKQRNEPVEMKSVIEEKPLTTEERYLREAEKMIREGNVLEARRAIRYAKLEARKSGAKIMDRVRQIEGMSH